MSLAVIGKGASYEFRWRTWALLRDIVVANLGETSVSTFCSLGDALVRELRVDASALGSEIVRIREWLVGKSFDEAVLGPRTAAMLHFSDKPTERRPMTRNELDRIRPVADSPDLADYFRTMLDSFAHVSDHPQDDGTLEVVDA